MEIRQRYWLLTSGDIRATGPGDDLPSPDQVEAGPFGSKDDAFNYQDTMRGRVWITAGIGLLILVLLPLIFRGAVT